MQQDSKRMPLLLNLAPSLSKLYNNLCKLLYNLCELKKFAKKNPNQSIAGPIWPARVQSSNLSCCANDTNLVAVAAPEDAADKKPGLLNILWDHCLKSPYIWLLAISYFFVYVGRQGVTSWFIFYLKVKHFPHIPP